MIRVAGVGYPKAAGIPGDPGEMVPGVNYQLHYKQFTDFRAGCWETSADTSVEYWDHSIIKNIPAEAFNDFRAWDVSKPAVDALQLVPIFE